MAKSVPQTRTAWAFLMASLSRINFDPGYSTLVADLLLTSDTTRNRTDTAAIDASFLMRKSHEGHWAAPEFIRVQTHLLSGTKSSSEKELTAALSLARQGVEDRSGPRWNVAGRPAPAGGEAGIRRRYVFVRP